MLNKYEFLGHKFENNPIDDLVEEYLLEAKKIDAIEILVVKDLENNEIYPVFIKPGDNREVMMMEYNNPQAQQKVLKNIEVKA